MFVLANLCLNLCESLDLVLFEEKAKKYYTCQS